jgi:carboxymethylenebutenolidase
MEHLRGYGGVSGGCGAGGVSRREFLRRLVLVTGGSLVGFSLAGSLACGPGAPASTPAPTLGPGETVSPNDPRIEAGPLEIPAEGATLSGYLSRPREAGPYPAVLVIHENRGLLPHFPDVTRRLALEGYTALTLDLLSRQGGIGSFASSDQARDALYQIPKDRLVYDLNAGVRYLQSLPYVRPERVGVIGFCFGGGLTWLLAVRNPALRAAVPFYGPSPPVEEVPNLQAAVLGIYAGNDTYVNKGVPELEAALKQHQKRYRFITYPGADHAFFNDTGRRYNPEAASQAWKEALAWLEQNLMS